MFGLLSARDSEVWKTELLPPSEVTTGNKNPIEPAFYHLGEWAAKSYPYFSFQVFLTVGMLQSSHNRAAHSPGGARVGSNLLTPSRGYMTAPGPSLRMCC